MIVGTLTIVGSIYAGFSWIIRRGVIEPLLAPILNNISRLSDSINRLNENQEKQSHLLDERINDHELRIRINESKLAVHDQRFNDIEKDDH